MNRAAKKRLLLLSAAAPLLMVAYTNCSLLTSDEVPTGYGYVPAHSRIQSAPAEQNRVLQSAEQLARSMASVTGVEYVSSIVNEYNGRKTMMTTNYQLKSVTAPMMISVANLASQYCNELVRKDAALEASKRLVFGGVDFSKGLGSLSEDQYNQALERMSLRFWGRSLTAEERTIFKDARTEFTQAAPANASTSSSYTRNLMLSTCSGMLSSFEFITI